MSILTVQFGQCGNQLGHALFSTLSRDNATARRCNEEDSQYVSESLNTWFSARKKGQLVARAVLVDTEDKVVDNISRVQVSGSKWSYCGDCKISSAGGGCGNNWAYGFQVKGPQLCERVVECIRTEAEKSDVPLALLNLLSSSGGTGSGLGSYIIEELRNEFVFKKFVNVIVLPYSTGEVATQNYNTVLTLAKLYDLSDMHFIFQNEQLHRMCVSLLGEKNTQLANLNNVIATKVVSVFQPVQVFSGLANVVSHMASHPTFKLATVKTVPHCSAAAEKFESAFPWPVLLKHVKRTLRKMPAGCKEFLDWEVRQPSSRLSELHVDQFVPSVANMLLTRGSAPPTADLVSELSRQVPYCKWVPQDARLLHFHQSRRLLGKDKFVTLVSNNSSVCRPVNRIVDQAWNTFSYKAYLHHYSRYGIHEDEFREAFMKVECILQYYADISKVSA